MTIDECYAERLSGVLEQLAAKLCELLREYCAGLERIDSISARAKSVERFVAKANSTEANGRPKYTDPLNDIQDQVGARIVTYYLSDVDRAIVDVVEKYFRPIEKQQIIPEPDRAFGYVGRHFILFVPTELIDEDKKDQTPKFFELQVKTLFQHAWSEANHDLAYKPSSSLSDDQRRLISFTAAQAWGSDQIFEQLSKELVQPSDLPEL